MISMDTLLKLERWNPLKLLYVYCTLYTVHPSPPHTHTKTLCEVNPHSRKYISNYSNKTKSFKGCNLFSFRIISVKKGDKKKGFENIQNYLALIHTFVLNTKIFLFDIWGLRYWSQNFEVHKWWCYFCRKVTKYDLKVWYSFYQHGKVFQLL